MKRLVIFLVTAIISFHFSGCGNETTINDDEASAVISDYLEEKPEYKTASFEFGEMKFRGNKDHEELDKYKTLEDLGYITMSLQEQKKVFLSKDSTFVYLISLTEKAAPLVLDQGKDKATVKTIIYVLDNDKPVNFVKTNDKSAKATVTLMKEETDFYPFDNNKGSNSEFITKTYKLKLKKEEGWVVSGEK
ncbi:MAG: hypothetical protein WC220_04320 [Pedobacter sp.]